MLKMSLMALALVGLTCNPAFADALGGSVSGWGKAFNQKSKKLKAGVSVAKESCKTEVQTACIFTLTDGLSVVAGSGPDKKTLKTLSVSLQTDNKMVVVRYLALLKVILFMYAPEADEDEVNAVLGNLVTQIADGDGARIELHGVKVYVVPMPPLGVITSIDRD